MAGTSHNDLSNVNRLINLSVRDMTATLMSNIKYFGSKHSLEKVNGNSVHFLTIWVVTDLSTVTGVQMLKNALTYMVCISKALKFRSQIDSKDAGILRMT